MKSSVSLQRLGGAQRLGWTLRCLPKCFSSFFFFFWFRFIKFKKVHRNEQDGASMFGIQEHLIREVSGLKERSLEEMDPVRSWVRNVGVVDANVAAQRYSTNPADPLTLPFICCAQTCAQWDGIALIFTTQYITIYFVMSESLT